MYIQRWLNGKNIDHKNTKKPEKRNPKTQRNKLERSNPKINPKKDTQNTTSQRTSQRQRTNRKRSRRNQQTNKTQNSPKTQRGRKMKLVVDTNIIISALIKRKGKTREMLLEENLDLYAPEYFLEEILNHKNIIKKKSKLSGTQLKGKILLLLENIDIVPKKEYEKQISKAKEFMEDIDPDDVYFLALALRLGADIWSNDEDFEKQNEVKRWKTSKLISEKYKDPYLF